MTREAEGAPAIEDSKPIAFFNTTDLDGLAVEEDIMTGSLDILVETADDGLRMEDDVEVEKILV